MSSRRPASPAPGETAGERTREQQLEIWQKPQSRRHLNDRMGPAPLAVLQRNIAWELAGLKGEVRSERVLGGSNGHGLT